MSVKPKIYQEPLSSLFRYLPPAGITLDAGCGTCDYAVNLKKNNDNILCIDLGDFRNKETGLPFCLGSITSLPIKSESIDFIYCITVLQYIPDQANAINEFYRILKPEGKLLFTVPTRRSIFKIIREMEIYFGVYPFRPSWNAKPYQYYTRKIILDLTGNKFKLIELRGQGYNFFGRLGFFFLNCARKNQFFEDIFSKSLPLIKRSIIHENQKSESNNVFMDDREIFIPKKTISKFADLAYHYIIVLEKR